MYSLEYLMYRFNVSNKTVLLWKKLNLLKFDKNNRLITDEIYKIDAEFIYLYRYTTYGDIENYFKCTQYAAKKLWKNQIIKEIELGYYKKHTYPRFLWKDIVDDENKIKENLSSKKKNQKIETLNPENTLDAYFDKMLNQFYKIKEIASPFNKEMQLFQLQNEVKKTFENNCQQMSKCEFELFYNVSQLIFIEILNNSNEVLININHNYGLNLSYDDIIDHDVCNLFRKDGMTNLVKSKGIIKKLFEQLLNDRISEDPQDDYPDTRKMKRTFYIHYGEPNSGKTYSALKSYKDSNKGIYLAPLRLLALEIYKELINEGIPCNLITGDEEIVRNAHHTASTIEKLMIDEIYDVAVIDEAQMLADVERGDAWTRAILGVRAYEIHVCASEQVVDLLKYLITSCNDEYKLVKHQRDLPLVMDNRPFTFPKSIEEGDALIVFSRKSVIHIAAILEEQGIHCSSLYGNLPPESRLKQMELFLNGETKVLVSTDVIGVGLNLPIKRVVFLETEKNDGKNFRSINSSEIKQIAGRAGRKGLYEVGYVNSVKHKKNIKFGIESPLHKTDKLYLPLLDSIVLDLPFGTLKERLIAWNNHRYKNPMFKKPSIDTMIHLATRIEQLFPDMPIEMSLKLAKVPFNPKDKDLIALWIEYCRAIYDGRTIHAPSITNETYELSQLELDYQKLSLFYIVGKTFNLTLDQVWIKKNKEELSQKICIQLKENIKFYKKKCRECGIQLNWDYFYTLCHACYHTKWDFYDEYDDLW